MLAIAGRTAEPNFCYFYWCLYDECLGVKIGKKIKVNIFSKIRSFKIPQATPCTSASYLNKSCLFCS